MRLEPSTNPGLTDQTIVSEQTGKAIGILYLGMGVYVAQLYGDKFASGRVTDTDPDRAARRILWNAGVVY